MLDLQVIIYLQRLHARKDAAEEEKKLGEGEGIVSLQRPTDLFQPEYEV